MNRITRSDVPCAGCRLCCRHDVIVLLPEHGDILENYDYEYVASPDGSLATVKKGPDGNCIYLGADGCTIHDRAPAICRVFDCRRFFLSKSRNERRSLVKSGMADAAVFEAGRRRLHTLPEREGAYR